MFSSFETDRASSKLGKERKLKALEELGVENVRVRLACSNAKPDDVFYHWGPDVAVSRGFAEDWLRFKDRRSAAIQQRWRWAIFLPACISAVAACSAALAILAPRLHLVRTVGQLRAAQQPPFPAPARPVAALPSAGSSTGTWQRISVDEYITVNGNIFQAECGPNSESIQRSDNPDVVRFQMVGGNRWYNDIASGDERTELDGYKQSFQVGVPYWTAYGIYVEPGSRLTADWIVLGQIPGLMGHFVKNMIMTWSAANKSLHSERIAPGLNYRFVEKIIIDPVNGYYGSWFNGKQVVDYHGPMGGAGKTYYPKFGIYRGAAPETMTVRYANYKFGTADLSGLIDNPDPMPATLSP
jgi:hypothetical protein